MQTKVLVAYSTNAGSTGEVAEAVAGELRKDGTTVDVKRLEEVADISPYQAVVVGAPMILIWLGALGYMLYNYVFYMYGAALNRAFLLYVALVALSLYALILGLVNLDVAEIGRKFRAKTPVKPISIFMLLIPLIMGVMVEIPQVMQMVLEGKIHPNIAQFGHPTAVVPATDLTLLFPALVIAAVLLWQHRPWGYVLTALLMFKGSTYTLALVFMSYFAAAATGSLDPLVPMYAVFCAGGLLSLGFLLGNMSSGEKTGDQRSAKKLSRKLQQARRE